MTKTNKTIKSLIAVFAFALILAIAFAFVPKAYAEEDNTVVAFSDLGATKQAQDTDKALGLTEGGVTVNGTATEGDTLYGSYVTDASGSIELAAGEYRVSLAIIKEAGTSVTVDGNEVDLAEVADGKAVVTALVTSSGSVDFEVTGKLCAVMATAPEAEVLMAAEYTEGQVVAYGKLITEELENAKGYYSSGEIKDAEIDYGDITAETGINENFNTVNVSGTIKGTKLTVSRYVITMPEDLVYFVNVGSYKVENKYNENGVDPYYEYNKTVFEHFDLINQPVTGNANTEYDMGRYKYTNNDSVWSSTKGEFPYSSVIWNEEGKNELGYELNGLTSGEQYRVFIGSLSKWHPRTVQIRFNGGIVGSQTLYIGSSKSFSVFEGVTSDGSGKLDILMTGARTNEPTIAFIAVQKMSSSYAAVPSDPVAANIIGMDDSKVTVTGGIQEGAKLQFYSAARPYTLIYEEMVDGEKIRNDRYTVDFGFSSETEGSPLNGVSQFNMVQITSGGVSKSHTVSITDIRDFAVNLSPDGYTTGTVKVTVTAKAPSGIASWSYRKGEFGTVNTYNLNLPYNLVGEFTATENDDYYIVVTSGLGVTYSEKVTVSNISSDRPVIELIPSSDGWGKGSYNVTLEVDSIAPIVEYALYRNGAQIAGSADAPTAISFADAGEYVISVTNEAGVTSVRTVLISAKPTVATIQSKYANRTLTYRFLDNADFKIASVSAYKVTKSGVSKMTISTGSKGSEMDVYNAGKYVVTVTATDGTVEMFAINAVKEDFSANKGNNGLALGVGLGVGLGGVVLAAAAVVVVMFLLKKGKKKAA